MAKSKKKIDLLKQELELYLSNPSLVKEQKGWTKAEYEKTIADLEKKISQSKRGRSSKKKGARYENTVAKVFKSKLDIDLKRTPQSGGFAKDTKKADDFRGDITCIEADTDFLLHAECKDHANWSLPAWIRQAEDDCPDGKIPIVIFHRRQKNSKGKRVQEAGDYVSLSLEDFLDIVDPDKIIKKTTTKKKKKKLKKLKKVKKGR